MSVFLHLRGLDNWATASNNIFINWCVIKSRIKIFGIITIYYIPKIFPKITISFIGSIRVYIFKICSAIQPFFQNFYMYFIWIKIHVIMFLYHITQNYSLPPFFISPNNTMTISAMNIEKSNNVNAKKH